MASRNQSRLLLRTLLQRTSELGSGGANARGVSSLEPLRSGHSVDGDATNGAEDFASKILLEMRGRKGEEVRVWLLCVRGVVVAVSA